MHPSVTVYGNVVESYLSMGAMLMIKPNVPKGSSKNHVTTKIPKNRAEVKDLD